MCKKSMVGVVVARNKNCLIDSIKDKIFYKLVSMVIVHLQATWVG